MEANTPRVVKKYAAILGCILLGGAIVFILQIISNLGSNKGGNGFARRMLSPIVRPISHIDLGDNNYYIFSARPGKMYLGNFVKTNFVLQIDRLKDTVFRIFTFPSGLKFIPRALIFRMDDEEIYSIETGTGSLFYFPTSDRSEISVFPNAHPIYAYDGVAIGNRSKILKTYDLQKKGTIICKYSTDGKFLCINQEIIKNQLDGIISTDGMLRYNDETGLLYYIYYYRNQFICFDTNLHKIYEANTLDTNSFAKVTLTRVRSGDYTTFSAPPPLVNQNSCLYDSSLYIQSRIIGNLEVRHVFDQHSVIDAYNAKSGRYEQSFYVPLYKGKKVKSFQIDRNLLITIQGSYLVVYQMRDLH